MNEHYRMAHCTALFQGITECQIIIILKSHTAQYDYVYFCLKRDTCQKLVIGLARY